MTRTPRSKPDVETTAAYAISQPLFDTLRAATASINEQRLHLITARDLVQQVHIQAPHANGPQDVEKYDRFVESAIQAWQCATEAFSNIFEALANVTGPDATTGRESSQEYEVFRAMAKTAADAKDVVTGYGSRRAETTVEERLANGAESAEPRGGDTAHSRKTGSAENRKRATSIADSTPLQHRPPKMLKVVKSTPQVNMSQVVKGNARQATEIKNSTTPNVEFEDVSTEIAARLRAKEERKKAKKDAKKRKRESNDSFLESVGPFSNMDKTDKPQRKKSKADEEVLHNEIKSVEVEPKRKKSEAAVTSQVNKKRKIKT
nr:hypothetical protein CFP56_02658 [Quercus suber]